jgi:glycosyltransferase involved in cell wall biosynthesis
MKILAVATHIPYPGVPHAGGEFLLRHLGAVQAHHDVTLLVPRSQEVAPTVPLAPDWLEVEAPPVPPVRWDRRFLADRARRRLRFRALHAPALAALRTARLAERAAEADLLELHWNDTFILTRELRRAGVTTPIVAVAHDLHVEAVPSHTRNLAGALDRLSSATLGGVRRRVEARDLAAADTIFVFKAADERLLRDLGVCSETLVLAPPIDLPAGPPPGPRPRGSLLFTGALWRRENAEGVRWFLERVWPSVVSTVPDATFTIAGAGPPEALQAAAGRSRHVRLTGEVPSFEPYYAAASAFVAPLFVAGGLKFKVPAAMAHGLPVVATPVAAAGVVDEAPPGALWAVTGDAATMATELVRLFREPDRADAVGALAASWSREHFSFERSTARVLDIYERLAARGRG